MGRTENLIDPPVTEHDAAALYDFYEVLLKKDVADRLSFLKSVTLLRRTDLREYIHAFALMKKRIGVLIPEPRQRDLLLSYPSTIQRVHELLWEGQEAYGAEGATVMTILSNQAVDYLDQTEMFRVDLDSLLGDCPSLLPDDAAALDDAILSGKGNFMYLLVALADHVFVSLLPHDSQEPTEAILKTRSFLHDQLGDKFDDQIIEFFVIGGGNLRVLGKRVAIAGVHPLFDPVFDETGKTATDRLFTDFVRAKHRLTLDTLSGEMPDVAFIVQG